MSEPWWKEGAEGRPLWGFLPWSDWLEVANKTFVIAMLLMVLAILCTFCS